jgi:GNAT superfamily N-acetyltransferase
MRMSSELRKVQSPEDWNALHQIRREVLFTRGRHPATTYDDQHPDDRAEGNTPYVLVVDGTPLGVVRLDVRGNVASVRLVAIAVAHQRRGYGRLLDDLIEGEAKGRGVTLLRVNSAPNAVGYYQRMGWKREAWGPAELVGIAVDCVQMTKSL